VKLVKAKLNVDGKTVHLSPGMAVTAEIKTGKRRVIEYFMSPLLQYGDESLRER
jgi:hemolysin D